MRLQTPTQKSGQRTSKRFKARRSFLVLLVGALLIGIAGASSYALTRPEPVKTVTKVAQSTSKKTTPVAAAPTPATPTPTPPAPTGPCASNTLSQLVLVSISKRHMWACDTSNVLYDSAVVTGMENLAADLTPTGTYHIYGKQTNLYLTGSDSTGSWHDYVYYWMPWLHNQYGSYGFHDATWRADSDFGNIDPYSSDASHGCVELPLATAKWLYNWAEIGTTVTVVS